jgi:hypothetical protein
VVRISLPPGDTDDPIMASPLAHQPQLLMDFLQAYGTLWSHGVVDGAAKEVARMRNARVTDCNY